MKEFIIGLIALIVILIISFIKNENKRKHKSLLKHSRKYKEIYSSDKDLQEEYIKTGGGKRFRKAIKEIRNDPQELGYIYDSEEKQKLKDAQTKMNLIKRNELAFNTIELVIAMWNNRGEKLKSFEKIEILNMISQLYPDVKNPEDLFIELTDAKVINKSYLGEPIGLNRDLDVVYHPKERDKNGRRIIILNKTIWSQPKEIF